MRAIADSSYLIALLNRQDPAHAAVAALARGLREAPWLITPALTEIAFVLQSRAGPEAASRFLDTLVGPELPVALLEPEPGDYLRCAALLRQYGPSGVDFVDAMTAAVAERLGLPTILTLDRRHFSLFRPSHCPAFELLP